VKTGVENQYFDPQFFRHPDELPHQPFPHAATAMVRVDSDGQQFGDSEGVMPSPGHAQHDESHGVFIFNRHKCSHKTREEPLGQQFFIRAVPVKHFTTERSDERHVIMYGGSYFNDVRWLHP
jgi:hypothetical protein